MFKVNFIVILVCQIYFASAIFSEDDCLKDVETQPSCKAYILVYKWDQLKQECIEAVYGGCHATENNFETKYECEKNARPVCKKTLTNRIFEEEDCTKDVEEGPIHCLAYIPVFKWDQKEQRCVKAIYGGCRGTNNNFPTEEECQKYAAPVCKESLGDHAFQTEDCNKGVEDGPVSCYAYIPVYTWSQKEQKCVKALYGGCYATPNNFKIIEDCQKYADPICKKSLGKRSFQIEDCNKGVENGPISCMARILVYTWSQKEQKCVTAIYGGCNATPNNFRTIEECQKYAVSVCKHALGERPFQVEDCEKGVENGPIHCKTYIPVYTWNQKEQKCVKATYGGCNATPNNFRTVEECQKYAAPVCERK